MLLLQALQKKDIWKITSLDKEKWECTFTTNAPIRIQMKPMKCRSFHSLFLLQPHRYPTFGMRRREREQTLNGSASAGAARRLKHTDGGSWILNPVLLQHTLEGVFSVCAAVRRLLPCYNRELESHAVAVLERMRSFKTFPCAFESHRQLHQCGKNSFCWIKSSILPPLSEHL